MKKVLVIDDEECICETLTWLLEKEGYSVTSVMDFEDASEIIANQDFDAYFIDLIFPGRNGIDLIKTIRELGKKGIVIIITGYPNVYSLIDSIRLNTYDYIKKPINETELKKILDHAFSQRVEEEV